MALAIFDASFASAVFGLKAEEVGGLFLVYYDEVVF